MTNNNFLLRLMHYRGAPKNLKPEAELTVHCANDLRQWTLEGSLRAVWFHVPNEFGGRKQPAFGALMSAMGRINGVGDFVFLWKSGCGLIELKTPTGRQTENQEDFQQWCESLGIDYQICRSRSDMRRTLEGWNILGTSDETTKRLCTGFKIAATS